MRFIKSSILFHNSIPSSAIFLLFSFNNSIVLTLTIFAVCIYLLIRHIDLQMRNFVFTLDSLEEERNT